MPGKFTDKNGGKMAGHADKWSTNNRRTNSHDAGAGRKGSRNQGTGMQGKLNTMPSQVTDTSKMNPEEKLKYFNALGLMPGKPDKSESELTFKTWPDALRKLFKGEPVYIKDISSAIKNTPPAKYKDAITAGFNATKEVLNKALDVYDSYEVILNAIVKAGEIIESTEPNEELVEDRSPLQNLQDVLSTIVTPDYVDAILKIIARIHESKRQQAINSTLQVAIDSRRLPKDEALKNILGNIRQFK